jgi:membrane fusion protein (multidrug efflux system)
MILVPRPARVRLRVAVALIAFAAVGCARGGPGGGFSMPPMRVETAVATKEHVFDRFEAVGSIEGADAITVVSEIAANVVSLPYREGRPVTQGALLAQLDDAQLKADVDRTSALRDQAHSTYDRVKSVVEQAAGSAQDLDDAAAALKVAEANYALAKTRLSKARITAPFGGVVGSKRVSPGAYLRVGDAITDLARISELKIVFSAPERYLAKLKPGAAASVSTTAYPGYALQGRIDVIDPVLDPNTRSARVTARARNPGGKFRPGMSANVAVVLSERMHALTIPSEAVFAEGNQTFVYVVQADSTVARRAVTLGTRLSDVVEVVKGLEAGQRVVRAGHQKLFESARVIPIESQGGGAGGGAPGSAAAGAGGTGKGAAVEKSAPGKAEEKSGK